MKNNVTNIKKKDPADIVTELVDDLMKTHEKQWNENSNEEFNPVIGLYDQMYWLVFIQLCRVPEEFQMRAIGIMNDAIGNAVENVAKCQDDHKKNNER